MLVQVASNTLIRQNILVDTFMAHRGTTGSAQPTGELLGAPVEPKMTFDQGPGFNGQLALKHTAKKTGIFHHENFSMRPP